MSAGCRSAGKREVLGPTELLDVRVGWLAGSWRGEHGGRTIEEFWTHPEGGTMLGAGRTLSGDRTDFHEFLRLTADGQEIVYHAQPAGRSPPTEFRLTEHDKDRAVFENSGHDFPQRIEYLRERWGRVRVRISGVQDGVATEDSWLLHRQAEPHWSVTFGTGARWQ